MLVNLVLGSVLWSTYAETSALVEQVCDLPLAVAAISGAVAGGAQALVAAPAENVRFLLEGGSQASGWSHAWQEVFRGTDRNSSLSSTARLQQARKVREWMREVGDMAGRGWDGWKWGMAKDSCGKTKFHSREYALDSKGQTGFAVFFAIFEVTRRLAADAKVASYTHIKRRDGEDCAQSHIPRIANAVTLVTGGAVAGLAYEFVCRPWDAARKAVHVDHIIAAHEHHTVSSILLHKVKEEGWSSFFQAPRVHVHETFTSPWHRRLHSALRTVARVGPWGVGFLVWEAFGPGLS